MKNVFYGLIILSMFLIGVDMYHKPRVSNLNNYKNHQIIEINNSFIFGYVIYLEDLRTKEKHYVYVYEIVTKQYKTGDYLK